MDTQAAAAKDLSGTAIRYRYSELDLDCKNMGAEFAEALEELEASEKDHGLRGAAHRPRRGTQDARGADDMEPGTVVAAGSHEIQLGDFERSPIQMSDSELKAVNNWLTNVETVSKPAADAVHENPTKANTQAAADAQDAAMKAEEQRQQAAIGAQRRAIERAEVKMVIRPLKKQKSHHAEETEKRKGKSVKVKTEIGEINLNPEQIKEKKKEHAEEFGIDKKKKDAEEKYRRQVIRIIKTSETIERGHYSEQHKDAIMFKNTRGEIVLVDAVTREFITCFVINDNHKHRWLDTMRSLTDEEKRRMKGKA